MSSSSKKPSDSKSLLSAQSIVIAGIVWAFLALVFFLSFSSSPPGWYLICTYIFEMASFLAAAILCLRNWRSNKIVSGRTVWLYLGLGTLFYLLGTLGFGVWELVFNVDPLVSPGDLFYIASYICLGCGMGLAVTSRRLNLELWQWGVFAAIAAIGIALAIWINNIQGTPEQEAAILHPPDAPIALMASSGSSTQAPVSPLLFASAPTTTLSDAMLSDAIAQASPSPSPTTSPSPAAEGTAEPESTAPGWVLGLEKLLEPLEGIVNILYVVFDIGLLIVATALLLAFWGGRAAQSWRMIAAAAVCLYIADIYTVYADAAIENYQSGALLEVFYIFSGVLFGIGAALEYATSSSRSRRGSRRRG